MSFTVALVFVRLMGLGLHVGLLFPLATWFPPLFAWL